MDVGNADGDTRICVLGTTSASLMGFCFRFFLRRWDSSRPRGSEAGKIFAFADAEQICKTNWISDNPTERSGVVLDQEVPLET